MSLSLLISAPHAKCNGTDSHHSCDAAAGLGAIMLCEIASMYDTVDDVLYFPADSHRTRIDLNRKVSRETSYRRKLQRILQQYSTSSHPAILLDAHSFPPYYMEEAGDVNFFKKGEIPPEIVLIPGPLDSVNGKSLCHELKKSLDRSRIRCKIIKVPPVNDIMTQAKEYHIPAVLIEICESLLNDLVKLEYICGIIINTIVAISK